MRDRFNRGWLAWLATPLLLVALDASAALVPFENVKSFYRTMPSGGDTRTATIVGADRRIHDALLSLLKAALARHGFATM